MIFFQIANSLGKSVNFQKVGATLFVPMAIDPLEIQTLFLSKTACSPERPVRQLKGIVD